MNKRVLVVTGLVAALLIGRYMIPSSSNAAGLHVVGEPEDRSANPGLKLQTGEDGASRGTAGSRSEGVRSMQRTSGVFINGRELSRDQLIGIATTYHYFPPAGRYWYDGTSGAWGLEGRGTVGFLLPGHDFGPLAKSASAGNTGVFINGRELNLAEALSIQQNFGAVYRGSWWLDGRTGNFGLEGNPVPFGNLVALLRAKQNRKGGDNFWCSATACGNDDGHSGYVNVDGTIVGYDH
jgi:hypothetical protein